MKYLIAILLLRQAYVNKKRRRIYLFLTVLLFSLPLISTIFYQTFYGEKNYNIKKSPVTKLKIIPIEEKTKQSYTIGKYTISYEAQAEIDLCARAVYIDFNKPTQKKLEKITPNEIKEYVDQGHFAKGSMLPKVQACLMFLENHPSGTAIISSIEKATIALKEEAGTIISNKF